MNIIALSVSEDLLRLVGSIESKIKEKHHVAGEVCSCALSSTC